MQKLNNTTKLGLLLIAIQVSLSCENNNQPPTVHPQDSLTITEKNKKKAEALKEYNKVYNYQVDLFHDPIMSPRLKHLLKDRYGFVKQNWSVSSPNEIRNNQFVAWGCQKDNCQNTNFIVVFNGISGKIYVGIREEGKVSLYSEDGSSNPEIKAWAEKD